MKNIGKYLLLIMILITPFVVNAKETCRDTKVIAMTSGSAISCDENASTAAKIAGSQNKEVFNNSVCKITCSENLIVSFEPVVKVLAGMGFRYPIYVSAERTCTAKYNVEAYESKIQSLVDQYANGKPENIRQQISNLQQEKIDCDNYLEKNKYTLNNDSKINLYLDDSSAVWSSYIYEKTTDDVNVVSTKETVMPTCNLNSTTFECEGDVSAVYEWTGTTKIFGKYTMAKKAYVEKYTGEVKYSTKGIDGNVCSGSDKYYTNFETKTNMGTTNGELNGYNIKLVVGDEGGLGLGSSNIKFSVLCKYQVDNLIYPVDETDANNAKYGSTAFQYRLVDLSNPFANREAYANWVGSESIITDTADNISSMTRWQIILNRSNINAIKNSATENGTDGYNYSSFNLDENEHSEFIKENEYIVDKR